MADADRQPRTTATNHHGGWCHSHPLSPSPPPGRFTQTTTNHDQATVHNHAQCQSRKCTTVISIVSCATRFVKTSLLPWDRRDQIRLDSWWSPSWVSKENMKRGFWPVELGRISPEEVRWGSSTGVKTGRLLATCCASTAHLISFCDVGRNVRLVLRIVFPLISSAYYHLVSGVEPAPLRPIRNLFRALCIRTANSSC